MELDVQEGAAVAEVNQKTLRRHAVCVANTAFRSMLSERSLRSLEIHYKENILDPIEAGILTWEELPFTKDHALNRLRGQRVLIAQSKYSRIPHIAQSSAKIFADKIKQLVNGGELTYEELGFTEAELFHRARERSRPDFIRTH